MEVIARIHNDFPTKFGLPRQSGLAPSLRSKIIFEPTYRVAEALRGLEEFSYICTSSSTRYCAWKIFDCSTCGARNP